MHIRKGAVAAIAGAVAVSTLAYAGVALGAGATGNPQSISYYRVAVSTTNGLRSYQISQTGYVRIVSSVGRTDSSRWVWGDEQFQPGYYASREKIKLVQAHGKVTWLVDTLTPIVPKCHATLCPAVYPIQFYVTTKVAYEGIITHAPNPSCFYRLSFANFPYRSGTGYWATYGFFYPMTQSGGVTRIVSKYSNGAQEVTEADSINSATKIFTASTFHFAAKGPHRAWGYKAQYSKLAAAPKPPHVTICR